MKRRTTHKKYTKGFTLVEMLVSIALFAVVLTMSVGTLLVLIEANGRAQSMQLVMTNLTFALDSVTREIRTGYDWYCQNSNAPDPDIPDAGTFRNCSNGNFISIVESNENLTRKVCSSNCSQRITYWLDRDHYGSGHGAVMRQIGTDTENGSSGGNHWVALTGPEIWVDTFRLVVTGTDRLGAGNIQQPSASVYISGRAGVDSASVSNEREFDIQTTVVQRLLDI